MAEGRRDGGGGGRRPPTLLLHPAERPASRQQRRHFKVASHRVKNILSKTFYSAFHYPLSIDDGIYPDISVQPIVG